MAGLNDELDDLPVYSDDLDQATPLPGYVDQPHNNPDVNSQSKVVNIVAVPGSILDRLDKYSQPAAPNAKELFGDNIVLNELPNLTAKFTVIKDKVNEAGDMYSFKEALTTKCAMCQEDAKVLDTMTNGQFLGPDKPLGYFTKDDSQTQYLETLKSLNTTIAEKNNFLSQEYAAFISGLKTNVNQFTNEFNLTALPIDESTKRLLEINVNGPIFDENNIHFLLENERSVNYLLNANIDVIAISNYFNEEDICLAYNNLKSIIEKPELKRVFSIFSKSELTMQEVADSKTEGSQDHVSISLKDLLNTLVKFNQMFTPFIRKTNSITLNTLEELQGSFERLDSKDDTKIKFIEANESKINLIQDYLSIAVITTQCDHDLMKNIMTVIEHLNNRILASQP
jgi:hypothetical protein